MESRSFGCIPGVLAKCEIVAKTFHSIELFFTGRSRKECQLLKSDDWKWRHSIETQGSSKHNETSGYRGADYGLSTGSLEMDYADQALSFNLC